MSRSLEGRTMLLSGGSRGIGLAIALKAAADGANVVLMAKTAVPHPRLEGTIFTAAEQIAEAGGQVSAVVGDVRSEDDVRRAVAAAVERFGGIDIVVNNAGAIDASPTEMLEMKRYDLMQDVNTRGTFLLTKLTIPHLRASASAGRNPHILSLSPPLNPAPHWLSRHLGYTLSKYGMSLCTLGFADELAGDGIAANSLWPRTLIGTAAVRNLLGGERGCRSPQIVAEAASIILSRDSRKCTGNLFIDEEVLAAEGIVDLSGYSSAEEDQLLADIFLDPA